MSSISQVFTLILFLRCTRGFKKDYEEISHYAIKTRNFQTMSSMTNAKISIDTKGRSSKSNGNRTFLLSTKWQKQSILKKQKYKLVLIFQMLSQKSLNFFLKGASIIDDEKS